jgi:glutamate synthase (NADPH/NADH) large chain
MSGGVAYVYDPTDTFGQRVNLEMVDLDPLDEDDREWLRDIVRKHEAETGSAVASRLLEFWHEEVRNFVKVMPEDYKRVLEATRIAEERGEDVDAAIMATARG